MALCASDCIQAAPRWTNACNITTRSGGIKNLVFFTCNFKFNANVVTPSGATVAIGSATDYTQWRIAVANRLISRTPDGYGEKPLSSFTTERLVACSPEAIVSETHTVSFISKDVDATNLDDCTYWNTVRNNYYTYRLGWIDCNGYFYGSGDSTDPGLAFVPTALGMVIPNNNDESIYYQADLSFKNSGIICPQNIVNLNDAFLVDVNT